MWKGAGKTISNFVLGGPHPPSKHQDSIPHLHPQNSPESAMQSQDGTNNNGIMNREGGNQGHERHAAEPAGRTVPTGADEEGVGTHPVETRQESEKQPPLESEAGAASDQLDRKPRKTAGRGHESMRYEALKNNHKLLKQDFRALEQDFEAALAKREADFEKSKEKWENQQQREHARWTRKFEDQEMRFETQIKQYLKERDHQQAELESLRISHIRSVNSVDTGLEPILDDRLRDKFVAIHSEVNGWCRKAFQVKGPVKELREMEKLGQRLETRIMGTNVLKFGQFLDTLLWLTMEETIFTAWFPGYWDWSNPLNNLEHKMRNNDSLTANEKAEYWRAYTASLLFQNRETDKELSRSAVLLTNEVCTILGRVLPPEIPALGGDYKQRLREISNSATLLAAEMRCQRGFYELEKDFGPEAPFDAKRMEDIEGDADEENGGQFYVTCVLSYGWVRRPYQGSKVEQNRICKARVLVARRG